MNLRVPEVSGDGEWRLTGRTVLLMLIGFFGAVMIVNGVMIKAAISTFGGVDTPSSYQAGLTFKAEEAAAAAQNARDWQVAAELSPRVDGREALSIDIHDKLGNPIRGAEVTARLAHPIDERLDVAVPVGDGSNGRYEGEAAAAPGQWHLVIEIAKDGERLFRSVNRVVIR